MEWFAIFTVIGIVAYFGLCVIYYLVMSIVSTCAYLVSVYQNGVRETTFEFIDILEDHPIMFFFQFISFPLIIIIGIFTVSLMFLPFILLLGLSISLIAIPLFWISGLF